MPVYQVLAAQVNKEHTLNLVDTTKSMMRAKDAINSIPEDGDYFEHNDDSEAEDGEGEKVGPSTSGYLGY